MAGIFDEKTILNRNKIYEAPAGTVILSEGEINLDMYKIVSGHVEMYTGFGTENETLIGIIGPGACFGEFGILTGQPAIYTIITYSPTRILRVTEALMGEFVQEYTDDIIGIMKNMATTMVRMQNQINSLNIELLEANSRKEIAEEEQPEETADTANVPDDTVELKSDGQLDYVEKKYFEALRKLQKEELKHYALYDNSLTDDMPRMRFINSRKSKEP